MSCDEDWREKCDQAWLEATSQALVQLYTGNLLMDLNDEELVCLNRLMFQQNLTPRDGDNIRRMNKRFKRLVDAQIKNNHELQSLA